MTVISDPRNKMVRIPPEESADFVKRFNAGVPSKQQQKSYETARKLFKRNSKTQN